MPPERRRQERQDNTRDARVEARVQPVQARIQEGNAKKAAIKAYRVANGGLKSLTDEQVWKQMQAQYAARSKPQAQTSQGRTETPKQEAQRKARQQRARNLAELHNNSFFGAGVTAPAINPEFAAQNPEYMEQVTRQNATYLPYAIANGITMGYSPSITSAVGNGLRTGWQTAGGYATRAGQALKTAGQNAAYATGQAVRSPYFWSTVGLMAEPAVAMADGAVEAQGVQSGGGPVWPWLLGGAAASAGLIWGGSKLAKGRKAAEKAATSEKPMFNWLWRRSPATEKRVAARGAYIDTYQNGKVAEINKMKDQIMGGVDAHTEKFVKKVKGQGNVETPNPNFISDAELEKLLLGYDLEKNGKTISAKGIYGIKSLEQPSRRRARIAGNVIRVGGLAGGLGLTGYGIYSAFSGNNPQPEVERQSDYDDIPDAMLEDPSAGAQVIEVIPAATVGVAPSGINVDSLDKVAAERAQYNIPIYGN